MSYTPLYTSEVNVEGLTQTIINDTSKPSSSEVLIWIEEIERRIVERALGSHTATDEYIDVPNQEEQAGYWTATWTPRTDTLRFSYGGAGIIVPLHRVKKPLISVTSLYKNDEDYTDAAVWEQLTEGPANNSSFIVLTSGLKALGYALYFYDNLPIAGPKRLKITYAYGYNVDSKILRNYCTLGASIKVIQARMGTSQADGLTEFQSGSFGSYVPTQYQARIKQFQEEMARIEVLYFPKMGGVPVAIL